MAVSAAKTAAGQISGGDKFAHQFSVMKFVRLLMPFVHAKVLFYFSRGAGL